MSGSDSAGTGLDLKIPPDVFALLTCAAMWGVSRLTPSLAVAPPHGSVVAAILVAAALGLIVFARVALARAGTTFSPIAPDRSTALVTSGVYRFTRNPIYAAMAVALLGVAVMLASPVSLLLVGVFVAYIDRFQIAPEERTLLARFGRAYEEYVRATRRWV